MKSAVRRSRRVITVFTAILALLAGLVAQAPASSAAGTVPDQITGANAAFGDGSVTFTFAEPADGGSPITRYEVSTDFCTTYQPVDASDVSTVDGQVTATARGLSNGDFVQACIQAVNANGAGPPSDPVFGTPDVAPNPPTGPVTAQAGDASATVSFTPSIPNDGTAVFQYTATSDPGGITGSCTDSPCTVGGLTNGVAYTFMVTAQNSSASSDPSPRSNAVTPRGAPYAPPSVRVIGATANTATVTFPAPGNGGYPITSYQISSNGGATWQNAPVRPGARQYATATGLRGSTRYSLIVRALNQAGAGAPSDPVRVLTTPNALSAPSPIRAGVGWVVVRWAQPNDAAIRGYTVYAHPGPATCSTYYRGDTACLIGAKAGVRYTYTVAARNAMGASAQSRTGGSAKVVGPYVPKHAPGASHALSSGKVSNVKRGGKLTVAGSGFLPFSSVYVATYGKKAHVAARLVANYRGQIVARIRMPKDKIKRYTIVAYGVTQYGSSKAISKTVKRR